MLVLCTGVPVPGVDDGVEAEVAADLPFFGTNLLPEPVNAEVALAWPTAAALELGAMAE